MLVLAAPSNSVAAPSAAVRRWSTGVCLLLLAAGALIPLRGLGADPFWVDEAESAINAMTILEHGYPSDTYLGIPIFENTLVLPWPGNPEYAFRDSSYSDRHVAIYHGWLPLYAMAASFRLHGIDPDTQARSLHDPRSLGDLKRRTAAARLPAVLFGAAFLAFAAFSATRMFGIDAALAALVVGAVHPFHIHVSQQARYYSAQITLTTACCLLLWLMATKGAWRHFVLAGIAFSLLFHTHLLSFITASAMALILVPFLIRRERDNIAKLCVFGGIVAAASLPWIVLTHFYRQQVHIPRGWTLLSVPDDLLRFPPVSPGDILVGVAFLLLLGFVALRPNVPGRIQRPFIQAVKPLAFLAVWVISGYGAFVLLIPAASLDFSRVSLSYWGPLLLLGAVASAALARAVAGRFSSWFAAPIFLALFLVTGHRIEIGNPQIARP